ncbi:Serine/arginine-rich SC35-like splicing factor SCL30A [Cucurbita argyrosperma subsp. argyrosperma]|nr:Serine/arginine-rich SC35-like splicing factor SCL30A [Cucurbita argyrosperma subsp. argyrosperma]
MRGRSYSYSPSPPRSYGRRNRSLSPRGHGGRGRDLPTSLLVRNLRHDCRPEDLRGLFGRFGPLKDIYLPRDYYSGKPRGFGFVQYIDPADAADAKYELDGQVLLGRELTVVFAEENRKRPEQMRARDSSRGRSYSYRRSPLQYSQSPPHGRKYSRSPEYYSPARSRRYSRWAVILCSQSRLGTEGTGSDPTQGHHMIQGTVAIAEAEAGAGAIAEAILGE